MQNFKLFLSSLQLQDNIIRLNTRSIPFSNRKYKGRKKLATKEKRKEKNTASPNINGDRKIASRKIDPWKIAPLPNNPPGLALGFWLDLG